MEFLGGQDSTQCVIIISAQDESRLSHSLFSFFLYHTHTHSPSLSLSQSLSILPHSVSATLSPFYSLSLPRSFSIFLSLFHTHSLSFSHSFSLSHTLSHSFSHFPSLINTGKRERRRDTDRYKGGEREDSFMSQ